MRLTWLLMLFLSLITHTLDLKIQQLINAWQILRNQHRARLRLPKLNLVVVVACFILLLYFTLYGSKCFSDTLTINSVVDVNL